MWSCRGMSGTRNRTAGLPAASNPYTVLVSLYCRIVMRWQHEHNVPPFHLTALSLSDLSRSQSSSTFHQ